MDDISSQINQILSDPESMNQIKGIMDSMGLGGGSQPPAPAASPPPDTSGLAGLGSSLSGLSGLAGGDIMASIAKLAPVISKVQQEDDSTRLLHALKPMLSEKRQKKLDEAVKVIQLLHLLPVIRETGILGPLFGQKA